ncbi:hypothetical protein [Jeotgalibacillus soli]|uniref:Uncharacterized protein n=1 Tax=Jeotgalibacillus soli TaxID=889306 RepID=A0A0C2VKM5_9BACL|nr:hypothetical protein [Jeotgalibacillus soli]KIL44513.1 hypothetical protein KP78_34770 [Jeotgalibacillus soli]
MKAFFGLLKKDWQLAFGPLKYWMAGMFILLTAVVGFDLYFQIRVFEILIYASVIFHLVAIPAWGIQLVEMKKKGDLWLRSAQLDWKLLLAKFDASLVGFCSLVLVHFFAVLGALMSNDFIPGIGSLRGYFIFVLFTMIIYSLSFLAIQFCFLAWTIYRWMGQHHWLKMFRWVTII